MSVRNRLVVVGAAIGALLLIAPQLPAQRPFPTAEAARADHGKAHRRLHARLRRLHRREHRRVKRLSARPRRRRAHRRLHSCVGRLHRHGHRARGSRSWYVKAGAPAGGDGSPRKPFASLRAVEGASAPGQQIIVLPAPDGVAPLDGGIALKPRQRLVGGGPPVVSLDPAGHRLLHADLRRRLRRGHLLLCGKHGAARRRADRRLHTGLRRLHRAQHAPRGKSAARITNTSGARHDGDAVVLADGAVVENLVIVHPFRGGVYGRDVRGVTVRGNDVSGQNTSCTPGFHIQPFTAPSNLPGVGVPISGGLLNGWAGIMLDARRVDGRIRIDRNYVHDADCGDGIDVRVHGSAAVSAHITANVLERLRQGEGLQSILAIGLQTLDQGRLTALQDHNRVNDIGNGPPTPEGADSEGSFANLDGNSTMDVTIDHFTYANPKGVGGFSSNGMELVTTGGSPRATMVIRNSTLSGSPGDILEEGNLGKGSKMSLTLDHVVATRSTGLGNLQAIPFNNGDCLVGGNGDAGNELSLRIVDSELSNCVNNGVSLLNANKPDGTIDVEIARSRITGNRGANLFLRDTGELKRLNVKVEDSALCNGGQSNLDLENDSGPPPPGAIDLGGGALAGAGRNDLSGPGLQARVQNLNVAAKHAWWGRPEGPALGKTVALGGSLEYAPVLPVEPSTRC